MARSEITVATAGLNSAAEVTADAVDVTNEHFIDVADVRSEALTVRMYGGTGDGFTATFKAGDFSDSTIGDLDVAVAASEIKVVKLEFSRFKDSDEYILIDTASTGTATAGTMEAYDNE